MLTQNNRIALLIAIALIAVTLAAGTVLGAEYVQAGVDYVDSLKVNAAVLGQPLR